MHFRRRYKLAKSDVGGAFVEHVINWHSVSAWKPSLFNQKEGWPV
jgi:hypothetical protein